ncbi:MAG: hypothetical protein ACRDL8_19805 [Solirubrobacteraceae bacterium]
MAEQGSSTEFEDIPLNLDDSEPDEVIGGHVSPATFEREMTALKKKGYIEAACTTVGALMYNPHTRRKVMVKY